jgi:hypothetical protein
VDLVGQEHQPTSNITTATPSPQHITITETPPSQQHHHTSNTTTQSTLFMS